MRQKFLWLLHGRLWISISAYKWKRNLQDASRWANGRMKGNCLGLHNSPPLPLDIPSHITTTTTTKKIIKKLHFDILFLVKKNLLPHQRYIFEPILGQNTIQFIIQHQ